jgi:hypothetical protein
MYSGDRTPTVKLLNEQKTGMDLYYTSVNKTLRLPAEKQNEEKENKVYTRDAPYEIDMEVLCVA